MNRRRLLVGVAVAMTAAIVWCATPRGQGAVTSGKALGATVRVVSLRRCPNGWVKAKLEVTAPRTLPKGAKLVVLGTDIPGVMQVGGGMPKLVAAPRGQQKWLVDYVGEVPRDTERVNIIQYFQIERPNKRVHIRFRRVWPDKLPIAGTFNGVRVKLNSVHVNALLGTDWRPYLTFKDGSQGNGPCFGVELQVRAPGGFHEIWSSHVLRDSQGKTHRLPACCVSRGGLAPGDLGTSWLGDSGVEKAVRVVSGKLADRMTNRRIAFLHEQSRREFRTSHWLYAFRPIHPVPEWFSFEMRGTLPPEPEDEATVVLRDVPIQ